jgi:hypothetical protein
MSARKNPPSARTIAALGGKLTVKEATALINETAALRGSAPSPERAGSFGRRPGVYAVPFKTELLPGVTFVAACVKLGETIAACRDKSVSHAVRMSARTDRHASVDALLVRIATGGTVPGLRAGTIVTGERGYNAQETAAAIVRAIALLKSHDNAKQAKRYTDRVRGECDRATGGGRAGANVIGWTDATAVNSAAAKRAANDPALLAAAREALTARSGDNSPHAVYAERVKLAAATPAPAAKGGKRRAAGKLAATPAATPRATGGKRRAATPATATPVKARQTPVKGGDGPGAGLTARRPRRPRKGV